MALRNQILAQQITSFHQLAENLFLVSNNNGNVTPSNLLQRISDGLTSERAKALALGFGGSFNGVKGDNVIALASAVGSGNAQGSLSQCKILIANNQQVNIKAKVIGRTSPLAEYYTASLEYDYKRVGGVISTEGAPIISDQGLIKTNYAFALTLIDIGGGEIGFRVQWTGARPAINLFMSIEYFVVI
ncbi:MAG: hypothetical protein ACK5OS_01935 [Chryseotalea sp.]|jgi:hypothetical protein